MGDGADRTATTDGDATDVQVLAESTVDCGGESATQNAVYATRPSGAGVFTAGTGRWACTLTGACAEDDGTRDFARTVTQNVIKAFATARAGRRHPVTS